MMLQYQNRRKEWYHNPLLIVPVPPKRQYGKQSGSCCSVLIFASFTKKNREKKGVAGNTAQASKPLDVNHPAGGKSRQAHMHRPQFPKAERFVTVTRVQRGVVRLRYKSVGRTKATAKTEPFSPITPQKNLSQKQKIQKLHSILRPSSPACFTQRKFHSGANPTFCQISRFKLIIHICWFLLAQLAPPCLCW